ncbi:MAG: nucleotidyltransferase domain-containing protein [Candidatus Woesearchaeota archaeon]|nr:nucleotidyltransferase domain-containing protein [Candidatus Woesearchaeota archaeon]
MVQNRDRVLFEIILALERGPIHVRALSKKILQPHSTVIRALSELEKLNAVDYRILGRNKEYFLRNNVYARTFFIMAEQYNLLKLLSKYPEIAPVVEDILVECKSRMVVLFGSYAKFSADKESDIDIYIETRENRIKKAVERINSRISVKIGEFDSKSLLIREIIKYHVLIRGAEEFYEKTRASLKDKI